MALSGPFGFLGKLNRGVSKPGGFPLFLGTVLIVSRTLPALVGAFDRPRKGTRTNRENPRTIPGQIGKIPKKSGKSQKGQKRTNQDGRGQIGKPPPFGPPPRLAALPGLKPPKVIKGPRVEKVERSQERSHLSQTNLSQLFEPLFSSGASGTGPLHGSANFKVEKAHFSS